MKNNTQEDLSEHLGITPQSVSKWERGESYPDITLLLALANIFETSIDLLEAMDAIRAKKTRSELPLTRESREVIQPLIQQGLAESEIDRNIKHILLGDEKGIW